MTGFFVWLVAAGECFCFTGLWVQLIGWWGGSIRDLATVHHLSDSWPTINATYVLGQLTGSEDSALILLHFQGHINLVNTST